MKVYKLLIIVALSTILFVRLPQQISPEIVIQQDTATIQMVEQQSAEIDSLKHTINQTIHKAMKRIIAVLVVALVGLAACTKIDPAQLDGTYRSAARQGKAHLQGDIREEMDVGHEGGGEEI